MNRLAMISAVAAFAGCIQIAAGQSAVTKPTVEGITNLAQVSTTVACAGAVKPSSVAGIKKMGFASIINLRLANEQGAEIDAEAEAAKAAGIKFIHLPFNGGMPDPAVADRFLELMKTPGTEPAFIHCASGNRAAAMWMIKRALMDKWSTDKASEEAAALGLTNPALKGFALDYIKAHSK
jgi:uncharacterized protein (TIGR01244 family)